MTRPSPYRRFWILVLVAVSIPLALAIETLARRLFFPPEFEELRTWLRPVLTPWVWACAPLALLAGIFALTLQPRIHARALARVRPGVPDPLARADTEALMVCSSIAQLPALAAMFGFMFGAALAPTLAAIAAGTAGVLLQALRRSG